MNYLVRLLTLFALVVIHSFGPLVPGVSAEDLIHVVGQRETVYSISRFYGVTPDELMRVNSISDPSKLQVGRRLVIPSTAASEAEPVQAITFIDYQVVRGDTLYSIARTHGITVQNLLEINRYAENHELKAGEKIKVPSGTETRPASPANNPAKPAASGIYALRWPVAPKNITYMSGQMGVVLVGERNEAVRSLTQGNVISAGPWRKFGRVVIVETAGGYYYMYGGCETLTVNVGDRIAPGTELGRLGLNTVSQSPQLFFMVFRNDNPIDPAAAPRAAANART